MYMCECLCVYVCFFFSVTEPLNTNNCYRVINNNMDFEGVGSGGMQAAIRVGQCVSRPGRDLGYSHLIGWTVVAYACLAAWSAAPDDPSVGLV